MKSSFLLCILSALLFSPSVWSQDFVVVESGIPFFSTASSTKPFLGATSGSAKSAREEFLTLQMLERKGERIRVKISALSFQCYSSLEQRGLELMLWLDRKHLEDVTVKELQWALKEGSQVTASRGMVVKKGAVKTRTPGLVLRVKEGESGKYFQKSSMTNTFKNVAKNRNTSFRTMKGESQCIRISRREGSTFGHPPKGQRVKAGSIISTPSGDLIGRASGRFALYGKAISRGHLRCFPFSMRTSTKTEICVHKDALVEESRRVRGRLGFGPVNVVGGEKGGIQKALRRRASAFKACYDSALKNNAELEGVVALRFKVGIEGKVTSVAISQSNLKTASVERCVAAVVRRIRFPIPNNDISVETHFRFSTKE